MIKLQASSWHRVNNCPGSLFLEQDLTEKYNPFGDQAGFGSLLHDASEKVLKSDQWTKAHCQKILKESGIDKKHPDYERAIHTVWFYISKIKEIFKKSGGRIQIEEKSRVDIDEYDCVAKADCIIQGWDKVTRIIDLKTGNYDYSESAGDQIEFTALIFPGKFYEGIVIQPWYWEEAYRVMNVCRIREEEFKELYEDIKNLRSRKEEFNPGPYCTFCPALRVCPSARLDVAVIEKTLDITNGDLSRLSDSDLSKLWKGRKRMEAFLKSLDDVIMERMAAGQIIPGLTIESYNGRRKWADEKTAIKKLEYLGDQLYDIKLKSPSQIEKLAGKKNIEGLVEKPTLKRIAEKEENIFEVVE